MRHSEYSVLDCDSLFELEFDSGWDLVLECAGECDFVADLVLKFFSFDTASAPVLRRCLVVVVVVEALLLLVVFVDLPIMFV